MSTMTALTPDEARQQLAVLRARLGDSHVRQSSTEKVPIHDAKKIISYLEYRVSLLEGDFDE